MQKPENLASAAQSRLNFRNLFAIVALLILSGVASVAQGGAAGAPDLAVIEPQPLNREMARWVILDARPKAEWQTGHIPGARSFSWEEYTGTDARGIKYKIRPPNELGKALSGMGIGEKTPVVVYGDADKSWGGEGWACWALAWLGHKGPVRLLNGGIQAWRSQGFPVAAGAELPALRPKPYKVALQAQLDVSTTELARLGSSVTLIDTRSTMEWLMGKIPGAIHIPWEDFFTGKERRPLSPEGVKKLLKDHGVPLTKPIVYYCLGGIRSGYAWSVHTLAGLPPARNYEGGYEEWKKLAPR